MTVKNRNKSKIAFVMDKDDRSAIHKFIKLEKAMGKTSIFIQFYTLKTIIQLIIVNLCVLKIFCLILILSIDSFFTFLNYFIVCNFIKNPCFLLLA